MTMVRAQDSSSPFLLCHDTKNQSNHQLIKPNKMDPFKVIIVEDVALEMKGTVEIFRSEIPEAEIVGTAMNETELWRLMRDSQPDLVLLDLGLGGSTTAGVDVCKQLRRRYPDVHVLIFTGEIMNEKLWVDALDAGTDGIILKSGELLTKGDV
jgi:DNA-binding NarL/FixJ family response regulator